MTPYRSREEPRAPRTAPETGLVADMVRQFADVHAFVRELVQNGIDAGATALDVRVERSLDGMASVSVADDGCGMTMEIVEDALLVLFRSTKDTDASKIGKYGVGFMSVFAIEPSEVTVDTHRGGQSLRVRLFPDHTYEIQHAAPRDRDGTTVTLWKPLVSDDGAAGRARAPSAPNPAEDFEPFWQRVAASLHRWCRHAEVPIQLTVIDGGSRSPPRTARADSPFDVRAAISVRQRFDDMEIVVGPVAGSGALPKSGSLEDEPLPFAGFYNRGLTLHEDGIALRPGLEHVRVKVNSPRLRHTLSRDDVRRDQAFHVALARAEKLASNELRAAVIRELAKEAEIVGRSGGVDATPTAKPNERLANLCEIAASELVAATPAEMTVPLAHAIEGAFALPLARVQKLLKQALNGGVSCVLATQQRTDLTLALASLGVPVVIVLRTAVRDAIERVVKGALPVVSVEGECLLVRESLGGERLPGDDALCARLSEALAPSGIDRVAIGRLPEGDSRLGAIVRSPAKGAAAHVVLARDAALTGKWREGSLLVLREDAEPVIAARRASSAAIGAHLLARYLLLAGPGLSSSTSEDLAVRALSEIP